MIRTYVYSLLVLPIYGAAGEVLPPTTPTVTHPAHKMTVPTCMWHSPVASLEQVWHVPAGELLSFAVN